MSIRSARLKSKSRASYTGTGNDVSCFDMRFAGVTDHLPMSSHSKTNLSDSLEGFASLAFFVHALEALLVLVDCLKPDADARDQITSVFFFSFQ